MCVCADGDWSDALWIVVNYERWARPNLICPCLPAADGPHGGDKTSSSEQMARNDDGDKLQALEALQCDKKWLSYGPARPGGFFAATARSWLAGQTRPCRSACAFFLFLFFFFFFNGAEQDYSHHAAAR